MANRLSNLPEHILDSDGDPVSGALVYFYEAGTTTPKDTYSDDGLTTANANPVVADSAGMLADVFIDGDYKVVAKTAAGVTLWTRDDISSVPLSGVASTRAPYASDEAAGAAGYATKAQMNVKSGETIILQCDPTSGDDLQAMCEWGGSRGHFVEQGGEFYIEIADGLHDVSTYVDITDGGRLSIRATGTPSFLTVTSATFSGVSGAVTVTVNVDAGTPLPARVVAGFAVGGFNVQGDGSADILNTGMIVKSRVSDTQFTADIYSNGANLSAFTTPDTGYTTNDDLGISNNRLMVPQCTIRANEDGWDGAAREGFFNALRGGNIKIEDVGFSFNGGTGEEDMFFAQGKGSEIHFFDYCVVAGAGEMVLRTSNYANIITNRCCLGGGITGANIWQGSGGGTLSATRTMMGSVSADAISAAGGDAVLSSCVVTGANLLLRTTYPEASIIAAQTRLSHGAIGVTPTKGDVTMDAKGSIKLCTTPIGLTGTNAGRAHGNPTISGNTNAAVTAFEIQSTGGVWLQSASAPYLGTFHSVGRFSGTLDFPSISAHSYADLTMACSGAAFNDFCHLARSGSSEPAEGVNFRAFVSSADTVTIRAFNVTTGAIDPASFTGLVLVIRAA
jgi:hypothetical protein